MSPPDLATAGPVAATPADIDAINALFSDAFTDRYHRDGMTEVRVPPLNPRVWRYALAVAGTGAMVWRDDAGAIAAFNVAHLSGTEGWMGPLVVRPDLQGCGLGSVIVGAGITSLRERGARTIGLETMPRTSENIGFYSHLGFQPGHLTISVARDLDRRRAPPGDRLSRLGPAIGPLRAACADLAHRLRPGVDYGREIEETGRLGLGDTTLLREGDRLRGFAVWHSAPLTAARSSGELRVLKLVAEDLDAMRTLVARVEDEARAERVARCAVRAESACAPAYDLLVALGYRVQWTDLRMTLRGYPEHQPGRGIIFSNWEI